MSSDASPGRALRMVAICAYASLLTTTPRIASGQLDACRVHQAPADRRGQFCRPTIEGAPSERDRSEHDGSEHDGSRAHATLLLGGGPSENIAAPGYGASVVARLRQWRAVRLEGELAGVGFVPPVRELCLSAACDNRHLEGAAWASALLVAGPGGARAGRGLYLQAGVGPYSAWGTGCLSDREGCRERVRALGLQGSAGVGVRFALAGRTWIAGLRALTLERATGRRGIVTALQFGPTF